MTQADAAALEALLETLGVHVRPEVLELALTHRSYAFENGGLPTNERLEFLGDAVLGLVVTEELYRRHPNHSEGDLARMRASVVNARALAEVARSLGVGRHVRLGRGEAASGGHDKPSILADTMEAILGAIHLDLGLDVTRAVILERFAPLLARASGLGAGLDWKTSLQEAASERSVGVPEYRITAEGPDHARIFHAEVLLGGQILGTGEGTAKKHAEQAAAEEAYGQLMAASAGDEPDEAAEN